MPTPSPHAYETRSRLDAWTVPPWTPYFEPPATACDAAVSGPASLTAREVEVLRHLARGMSSQQIAERLVISRKTASNHIEHIYAKIGVSNRAMASLFATRHGLL